MAPELVLFSMALLGFASAAAAQIPAPDDVAAAPADAMKTSSGLAHKLVEAGTGTVHPGPTATVVVHYTGWLTDGTMFDSSVARGEPISFPLDGVIAGWTEGVQLMVVGEKRRFWIPSELGYGDRGVGNGLIPGGASLVFDVELRAIQ
jgi:FKBP-type peptidyl-prolyl cis-trans isomerase